MSDIGKIDLFAFPCPHTKVQAAWSLKLKTQEDLDHLDISAELMEGKIGLIALQMLQAVIC